MQARYLPWALAGGACVVAAPGTALWIVPMVGAAAHMLYDTDPEGWKATGTKILTDTKQLQLTPPPRVMDALWRLPGVRRPDNLEDIRAARSNPQQERAEPVQVQQHSPLFSALDQCIHELYIGYTNGGKTTLMHERAAQWRTSGHPVLVCDPDAAPGLWPGCRVVGGGDNFEAIGVALGVVEQQITRRRQERAAGRRSFPLMYVVLDEVQDTIGAIPESLPLIETMLRRGRKIGVRCIIGVQDKQVKTLGIEGKSELLGNLTRIKVKRRADGSRAAEIDYNNGDKPAEYPIPQLTDPESLIIERPKVSSVSAPAVKPQPVQTPDDLLVALLAEQSEVVRQPQTSLKAAQSNQTGMDQTSMSPDHTTTTTIQTDPGVITIHNTVVAQRPVYRRQSSGKKINLGALRRRQERYATVRSLVREGLSGNKIRDQLGGDRTQVLALVRQAKAELGERP